MGLCTRMYFWCRISIEHLFIHLTLSQLCCWPFIRPFFHSLFFLHPDYIIPFYLIFVLPKSVMARYFIAIVCCLISLLILSFYWSLRSPFPWVIQLCSASSTCLLSDFCDGFKYLLRLSPSPSTSFVSHSLTSHPSLHHLNIPHEELYSFVFLCSLSPSSISEVLFLSYFNLFYIFTTICHSTY